MAMISMGSSTTPIQCGVQVLNDAAPGEGPRLHRHRYREVFVVLEGDATFTLGADQCVARAGEIVVAPPGVAHRFVNTGRNAYARSTSTSTRASRPSGSDV
jgi:mannose-6-phosphate isomerase-like protein (cupin superfamily)